MCGFVGIWDPSTAHQHADQLHHVKNMAKALRHRGPDDAHSWSESSGLYLGHTRLSIHDLSPAGKQPMASNCGRFTVAFNGEIYNYRQLRDDLAKQGLSFRTDCDTEVLLSAISHWGLEAALEKFNGMFAFALWDSKNRQLSLARDRIGKKPLYFGIFGGQLLFGSELKALRRHPAFQADINPTAVRLYLEHSYIPGNQSIYTDAHKLPAASIVTL
ncbi:MAG: asparagine synthetase B, partial [Gammaproteobacteria bacterium]|nr:asparagine synthetase B [Gammaproteobacteria bacterium]